MVRFIFIFWPPRPVLRLNGLSARACTRYTWCLHPNAMRENMNTRAASIGMLSASFAALLSAAMATSATAQPAAGIRIVPNDIGGVVTGAKGPEAGVWGIGRRAGLAPQVGKTFGNDDTG